MLDFHVNVNYNNHIHVSVKKHKDGDRMTDIEKLEQLFVETADKIEYFRTQLNKSKDEIYYTTYANGIVACIALLRNDDSEGGQATMDYLCEKYKLFHCAPHDPDSDGIAVYDDTTTYPTCADDIVG